MRNIIQSLLIVLSVFAKGQTVSITNNSGTNSLTCVTQSINMTASCVGFSTVSTFTWVSNVAVLTGSNVNINIASVYTVMTMNGNMMVVQTFTVYQNTTPPVCSISSTFSIASGTVAPTMTMVAISPTVNIQHEVYAPTGGTFTSNSPTLYYSAGGPGTYTHCIFWMVNGCSSCQTFTIVAAPTSLTENTRENFVRAYQNMSGEICIEATKRSILSLYDLSGQCLKNFTLEEGTGFRTMLPDIQPGIYVLVSALDGRRLRIVVGNP